MSLLVVGLNHRTAPVRLLERAAVPASDLPAVLRSLLGGEHVAEAVLLSTCNRVEVYAAASTFHGALHEIGQVLSARTAVHIAKLADHLYVQYADDAVRHLFRVVSGLDSMVVGEAQVLGQLRDAYTAADGCDGAGPLLHGAMQHALRVGKRVHTETSIDRAGQSVVTAALKVGASRVGPLAGRPALVVGAGSLGALAAATLRRDGVGPITVLNRTAEGAERVAAAVGGRSGTLADLPAALADADVLVTAAGSGAPLVTRPALAAAFERRDGRELLVLDLAVPRDTDRAVDTLPGVTVVDIEALAAVLADEPAAAGVDAALAIVAAEVTAFGSHQRSAQVGPTVAALRARADEVVATELTRLRGRLPGLDAGAEAELERTVRRVVSTLLHLPTVRMKELAAAPGGDRYTEAVRDLFLLDLTSSAARALDVPTVGAGAAGPPVAEESGTPA